MNCRALKDWCLLTYVLYPPVLSRRPFAVEPFVKLGLRYAYCCAYMHYGKRLAVHKGICTVAADAENVLNVFYCIYTGLIIYH